MKQQTVKALNQQKTSQSYRWYFNFILQILCIAITPFMTPDPDIEFIHIIFSSTASFSLAFYYFLQFFFRCK